MELSKKKRRISTMSECSICLQTITKPKVLPCGHTFCLSCLLGLPRDADRITCPQCRNQHNIPDNGMQQFIDNYALISMIDLSSSHAPTSVCEACGENGDHEFCDHCQKDVCEKCCALHKSSMVKIQTHIEMISKMFYSQATAKRIIKNPDKWQTSLDNIVRERAEMDKYFTKCVEVLESRRKVYNDYFDTLDKLHNIFLRCTDLQESKLLGDKLCEDLTRSCTTCTNTRKLEDMKSSVSQLQELSQMMLAMETDDSFIFVGNMTTITQLSSLGDVTLGGTSVEIRGKPAACAIVPQTRCLQVNYTDKGGSSTIIPAWGATDNCDLRHPTGVACCSRTNTILVADWRNGRIMRFDMDGSNGRHFVRPGDTGCGEYTPQDVATSRVSGRVFATDDCSQRVLVFTCNGDYVRSFGSRGTGDDQFSIMGGGITCHNGCVMVCDQGNGRVTMVTEDGVYIRHIVTGLSRPLYVAVGPDDTIYVTNCDVIDGRSHGNVHVYRWDGSPVRQFGDREGAGSLPEGVTVDHQGYVCVAWFHHHRVDVYNPQGELHTTFGREGEGPGEFKYPHGMELLPDGRIVVCDSYNHRLQIV